MTKINIIVEHEIPQMQTNTFAFVLFQFQIKYQYAKKYTTNFHPQINSNLKHIQPSLHIYYVYFIYIYIRTCT